MRGGDYHRVEGTNKDKCWSFEKTNNRKISGDIDQEKAQLFNQKPNRRYLATNIAENFKKKKDEQIQ